MSDAFDSTVRNGSNRDVEDLFGAAFGIARENRQEYIEVECGGNFELRNSVLHLIASHEKNESSGFILDKPIFPENPDSNPIETTTIAEREGDTIGRYRLQEKIGEGGMGVVYMAEQLEDVHRQVALKIIKLGMDTRQVIARFEVERQAMAMFDHANITRVFDAGATETGRPYFVMELVRGTDIVSFVTRNEIDLRQRLELFVTVCQAIQHSHQKGIIHRDLKPSNILITYLDGVPIPKVIDFGIAKALDQRLTEKSLYTRYAAIMGTPQYMSPEQADLSGTDIDTRSDIYSLGILLYELITGSTPLKKAVVERLHPYALLDTIRQHNIETPSTRLAKQESTPNVRGADSMANLQGVGRELDCIVMKAVAQERSKRYPSATELAADIQRYLNGDPVEAVAPTRMYRLRTYFSKNRKQVVATAGVGILLIASSIVCTFFALNTFWANKTKDRTVVQLSSALHELNAKHDKLIVAEKEIRDSAENQKYQAAIESALAKFQWTFYCEIRSLLPTYVDQESISDEDGGEHENRPVQFVQMVPPHYLDYQALLDLKHRHFVETELQRLEKYFAHADEGSWIRGGTGPDAEIDSELKVNLAEKTVACRNKFFRGLLKEYRVAFGAQDPRIANTINLFALALIESNQHAEAEAYLREALAISNQPDTNETSERLLEMVRDKDNSHNGLLLN